MATTSAGAEKRLRDCDRPRAECAPKVTMTTEERITGRGLTGAAAYVTTPRVTRREPTPSKEPATSSEPTATGCNTTTRTTDAGGIGPARNEGTTKAHWGTDGDPARALTVGKPVKAQLSTRLPATDSTSAGRRVLSSIDPGDAPMTVPVIDMDAVYRTKPEPRVVTHVNPGCFVHQHYHGWQPARCPRCSARFWCASCRVWFDGGRCFPDLRRYG
jgi:hypothetical protein